MKIDSHHHVWDLSVRAQDWMTSPDFDPINKTILMSDFDPELNKMAIDHTVLVQTVTVPEETPEFLDIAANHSKVAGVVGWLDLENDISWQLEQYLAHPAANKLVAIRDQVQQKSDINWLAREGVIKNLQALGKRNLSYDLLTLPPQLPAAVTAVEKCPDTYFVMDHISKPYIAKGELAPWAEDMAQLAKFENVSVKVSGMVTEANWKSWKTNDFRPYVEHLLEHFGPKRLMFGSDWPVCLLSATYSEVINLAEELTSHLSEDEKEYFWGKSAINAYRLDV
jgi:L-fuconolactonase